MAARLQRKPKGAYHHPDLEKALIGAALRTIEDEGIDALTLRGVGARLGVSRSALYRHFEDKAALLARVALEGFREFTGVLTTAVERADIEGLDPLEEMGAAYVDFALNKGAYYRTMFGGAIENWERYPELHRQADASFEVLRGTIEREQMRGNVIPGDPEAIAFVLWSNVHGMAELSRISLKPEESAEALARFGSRLMRDGISARRAPHGANGGLQSKAPSRHP